MACPSSSTFPKVAARLENARRGKMSFITRSKHVPIIPCGSVRLWTGSHTALTAIEGGGRRWTTAGPVGQSLTGQKRRISSSVLSVQSVRFADSSVGYSGTVGAGFGRHTRLNQAVKRVGGTQARHLSTVTAPKKEDDDSTSKEVEQKKKKPVIDSRVWPIAASTLVGGTAVGVLFPVMPIFAQELGLSSKDFGLVVSIVGFSRLVVNIPAAWLTDRYGRRFTLIGGPLISGLGMAFMGSARSLWELVGYRFLTGLGGSFQMTGAQMYLSDISTPENRARTMAPTGIAFATGATIGPAIGGYLSEAYGLQAPFFVVTTAIALVAALNARLVPETRPAALQERKPVTSVLEEFKAISRQWKPLLSHPDMRRVLGLHLIYWSVQSGCQWTLLPLLASSQFGFTAADLGKMFAMLSAIGIVGLGPAAFISDRFGRKATILPATLLVSGALATIPFVQTKEQLLMAAATYAIGATLFNSTPSAFVADITTEQTRGQALALLRSAGDAGLFLGAGGLGALAHATSSPFAFGCASTALALAGANFVLRKNTGDKVIGLPSPSSTASSHAAEDKTMTK